MDYLLAVQVPAYALGPQRFAIESAFAIHLKALVAALEPQFDRLVLLAPPLQEDAYIKGKSHLTEVSAVDDKIVFMPLPEATATRTRFWMNAWSFWRRLRGIVKDVGFVHSGLSADTWRPYLAMLNLAAQAEKRPGLFVIDIDFRTLSRRYYKLGIWSPRNYWFNRVFHDVAKRKQLEYAIRNFDLVLLKSMSMVQDLGGGRESVKFFLNAAHSDRDVITDDQLERRLARVQDEARHLQLIYFGRLVPYKGGDFMLDAVARARAKGARIALTVIGDGESLPGMKAQVARLGLSEVVTFHPAVAYGPALFDLVDRADVAIATPKVEDTPRAALDAMARGLPIVAFDIDYFKTLFELSGAVALAAWPDPDSVADEIVRLDRDRERVAGMSRKGVAFARANSQDIWLRRRIAWTFEALQRREGAVLKARAPASA